MKSRWTVWVSFLLLAGLMIPRADAQPVDGSHLDIATIRQKVYPALVNIAVVMRYYNGGRVQRAPAGGSGVIVSKDGYVLTNYHVAGNTTRIKCTMPNGETLDARVVLDDPLTDLSVLKLAADDPKTPLDLPFVALGDSDALQVGDYVVALGNPLMLSSSVTLGVVSNTKRVFTNFTGNEMEDMELDLGEKTGLFTRWIQHDALILPGNSGGPLVNMKGEVVGINELGSGGVGFAIPSNIAAKVLKAAQDRGKIERAWLGITVLPVKKAGLTEGALLSSIWPGSPADRAGLQPGDILTAIDEHPINARFFEEVPLVYQWIADLPPGKSVTVHFKRNGEAKTVMAILALMKPYLGKEEEYQDMGVTLQEITEPMALERDFPNSDGLLVTGVRPGYPFEAAKPSIQPGDVVLKVGDVALSTSQEFRKILASVDKTGFPVTYRRNHEILLTIVKANEEKPDTESNELPKAWLGVKTQVVTPEVRQALHWKEGSGFRISEVFPFTEANTAGLKVGDIITGIDKEKLTASRAQDSEDLKRVIEDLPIGEIAQVNILREGKPMVVKVKMETAPTASDQAKTARQKEFEFSVREIMRMDRIERSLPNTVNGVLVTESTEGGLANISGLDPDDIIVSINGQTVDSVAAFESVMAGIREKKPNMVQFFVRRDHRTHFVFLEPEWQKLSAE
jgi:serine protease Do